MKPGEMYNICYNLDVELFAGGYVSFLAPPFFKFKFYFVLEGLFFVTRNSLNCDEK